MLRSGVRALAGLSRLAGPTTSSCSGCARCFRTMAEPASAASFSGRTSVADHIRGESMPRALPSTFAAGPASFGLQQQQQQQRGMFIQTQATPNPTSLMFMPGQSVMESGVKEFKTPRESMSSPLAKRLFGIDGVSSVFFGSDFVTVTKSDEYPWSVLKPDIFAAIMDHYQSGEPMFLDSAQAAASDTAIHEDDSEIVAMIKELLDTRIRPAVAEDGGDIVYQNFEEDTGRLLLQMRGACSGCPSSAVTLKSGIENMLRHYIPEVQEVVEVQDESQKVGESEFSKLEQQLSA